jgi:hypothetical protein
MIQYPKDVLLNFRKLDIVDLKKLLMFYKSPARESSTHEELAAAVARMFRINTGFHMLHCLYKHV